MHAGDFGARLERRARSVGRRVRRSRGVEHRGFTLPPPQMRLCGQRFKDNEAFLAAGVAEAKRLERKFGLTRDTYVLDVGCGPGRIAIGLLAQIGEMRQYTGIDVGERYIAWCRRHIERHHPGFRFHHIDVENARYHPDGRPITADFRLPFDDASFEVISLYSVFSHMEADDVAAYLREFQRLLRPSGGVFLTAFLEDGVEDLTINPPGYGTTWSGELHCVRFSREYFYRMVTNAGLGVDDFEHGTETDGQSAVYLRLPS